MFSNVYKNRKVLLTGHTGFKGTWLSTWLLKLGANVAGYSVGIPSEPSNYVAIDLKNKIQDFRGDIRDKERLSEVLHTFKPEILFHLAAQSLVSTSFEDPSLTIETNAIGTMNLLDCLKKSSTVKSAVIITSDKCYKNQEWIWGYRENDLLGGDDPYSASKACAEIICSTYFNSFFKKQSNILISTARAGNVIGGGDWAKNRIIPDCMKAIFSNNVFLIRSPNSIRPWQHVLEPLSGYLLLASEMFSGRKDVAFESFNFGPRASSHKTVLELTKEVKRNLPEVKYEVLSDDKEKMPETKLLRLSCEKSLSMLNWETVLSFSDTVLFTTNWYKNFYSTKNPHFSMYDFSENQIEQFIENAKKEEQKWTQ
ncbi:MAG: CDP-glucose 4,6-dehydratase [Candidatus Riflebacteria bacterium]|nr:CDP-glucose 4,6-dehydratase [Candidatus Riflebacteria bacterium]